MKTLDEVIKGMEHCHEDNCMECPYQFEPKDFDCITQCQYTDALHYLKEYKANQEDPDGDHQQLEKCRALLQDFYRNDPLSWDELKSMEGKPVWIEQTITKKVYSGWVIAKAVTEDYLNTQERLFWQRDFDKTWRAYRHERD